MNSIERAKQIRVDEQILHYVRGMQDLAPVTLDAVHSYLTGPARIAAEQHEVRDRLHYLAKAGCLDEIREWGDGREVTRYEITSKGMDILDGNIPPLNWDGGKS